MKTPRELLCGILCLGLGLVPAVPALAETQLVKTFTVEQFEQAQTRTFFGRVKARQTVDLAFQVGGQVLELPIEEGQPTFHGDLIAELDLEPFELALRRANAQSKQAADDFNRLSNLSGSTVSQVTVDDARTAAELAEITVRDAERALQLARLEAPFDGIVARRLVSNFSTIGAGAPIVRLHDMSDIRIEIEVPELLFQQAGQNPNVELQAEFASSSKRYKLEFREVVAETTQIGQTFTLTLGMDPPSDLFVLPGSSATVYARLLDQGAPIIIPASALVIAENGSTSVMVFSPNDDETGTVGSVAVEVIPSFDGSVQVVSGLDPGQEIVSAGAIFLSDGDTVKRFTGFAR